MPALILGFIVATTALNIVGFRFAKGVNGLLMGIQAVVIVLFVTLAFVFVGHSGPVLSLAPFSNPATGLAPSRRARRLRPIPSSALMP